MGDVLRMLARLTSDTQAHHADADGDVDRFLFRGRPTVAAYREYLARAYGFLLPLEHALAVAPGLDEVIDVRVRSKAPLIVHDLLALGMTMDEVHMLPVCTHIPVFRGPAAALGWMYVSERPMLSASVLRGHLASSFPSEMAFAASYLNGYQGQAGTLWRELGQAMDRIAYSPVVADRMVIAAHEGFRSLSRWRRQGAQETSAGIRAAS